MKLLELIFISTSVFLVHSKPPHLFGNGCIAANGQLFMVGFDQIKTEEQHDTYYMEIPTITNINEKVEIEWKSDQNRHVFPGKLIVVEAKEPTVYYILNGISPSDFMDDIAPIDNNNFNYSFNYNFNTSSSSSSISYSNLDLKPNSKVEISANQGRFCLNLYKESLPRDIRIAVDYNEKIYFIDNKLKPTRYDDPLNFVTIENLDGSESFFKTEGDIPINKRGFSAAIHENNLFVTGGEFDGDGDGDSDSIFVLNLDTLKWSKHHVKDFQGARSGCLSYYDGYLIHAFGIRGGSYLSSTQFVDTKEWVLVQASVKLDVTPPDDNSNLIPTIVGVSCGVLLIITITLIIFYFRRRVRNLETSLLPPKYFTKSVWAEHRFSRFDMDVDLMAENSSSFFDTISEPPESLKHSLKDQLIG